MGSPVEKDAIILLHPVKYWLLPAVLLSSLQVMTVSGVFVIGVRWNRGGQ